MWLMVRQVLSSIQASQEFIDVVKWREDIDLRLLLFVQHFHDCLMPADITSRYMYSTSLGIDHVCGRGEGQYSAAGRGPQGETGNGQSAYIINMSCS